MTAVAGAPPLPAENRLPGRREVLEALSGLMLAMFVAILSSTIVANALPTIVADLHGGQTAYTWVVTATLLTTTATTPVWGKLADLYPKKRLVQIAISIFVVGSALAGLGGVMWGLYQQTVLPQMGAQVNVLIFIVIIIGGLGSTLGALIGALLVGLMANYTGFLAPKVALFSNIALMVAILLWRPQGVYPVTNR